MKKFFGLFCLIIFGAVAYYQFPAEPTFKTQASSDDYESQPGCKKQDDLWQKILNSNHKTNLPDLKSFGFTQAMAMAKQGVSTKGSHVSDFAPEWWTKHLHARGSIAKIKIVPMKNSFTGAFQGVKCGLIRLSLTYKVEGNRPVAPGLALKIFRDHIPSGNISALVSLDGQGLNYNFFENPFSNIVPMGTTMGQRIVHRILRSASRYPEELVLKNLAQATDQGVSLTDKDTTFPRQLFFTRATDFKFANAPHDVRSDFSTIPSDTNLFHIYAAPEKYSDFDYTKYTPEDAAKFLAESSHIADVVTTSEFVSSEFGDSGIFFNHELR